MDAQPPKRLIKIRTFAQDIEKARKENGMVLPAEETKKQASAPAPKLGAVKSVDTAPTPDPILKATEKASSEHIPAFHELQKKSAANNSRKGPDITVGTQAKASTPAPKRTVSVRAKKRDLKAVKNVGGGTIITDSKAEGFKLVPSVIKSIDDWFKELKKIFKKKTAPKYVITDTERRRGVIQKATSKTGSIFTADNETLKEEIRRRQQIANTTDDVDINWSPNTEAGYALLESGKPKPVTSNVSVAFKKQSTPTPPPTPTPVAPEPVSTPTPVIRKAVVPAPVIVEPSVVAEIVPEPAPEVPEPSVEPISEIEEVEEVVVETPAEEYELTTPEEHYKIRSLGDITRINTNILSIGIIGAIAGLIIFIVIVRTFLTLITPNEIVVSVDPPTPLAETTSAQDIAIESVSTQAILSAVQTTEAGGVSEFRFVDTEGQPLSMDVLLPALGFKGSAHLNRSITDIRLVTRGQERGLIFTVTDSTTAFGSLLAWEKTLVPDVAESLGITSADISGGFSDRIIRLTDIRVYTTNNAEELLVYGFIDENTVVITTSQSLFAAILGAE